MGGRTVVIVKKKKKEIVVSMYTKKGKPRIYTEGGGKKEHLEQNTRPLQNITSKQKVSLSFSFSFSLTLPSFFFFFFFFCQDRHKLYSLPFSSLFLCLLPHFDKLTNLNWIFLNHIQLYFFIIIANPSYIKFRLIVTKFSNFYILNLRQPYPHHTTSHHTKLHHL